MPIQLCGRLIGRGGSAIQSLQQACQCHMSVGMQDHLFVHSFCLSLTLLRLLLASDNDVYQGSSERLVSLSGGRPNIASAIHRIVASLREEFLLSGPIEPARPYVPVGFLFCFVVSLNTIDSSSSVPCRPPLLRSINNNKQVQAS